MSQHDEYVAKLDSLQSIIAQKEFDSSSLKDQGNAYFTKAEETMRLQLDMIQTLETKTTRSQSFVEHAHFMQRQAEEQISRVGPRS